MLLFRGNLDTGESTRNETRCGVPRKEHAMTAGVLNVTYNEDAIEPDATLTCPDGTELEVSPSWIAAQCEAGVLLLVSLVNTEELIERLD
jgi:hypothetical protein